MNKTLTKHHYNFQEHVTNRNISPVPLQEAYFSNSQENILKRSARARACPPHTRTHAHTHTHTHTHK